MSTIKEVADHARVSVATVSRVINKTGYVSLDLQERVIDAMRSLNYQPSALARSLRRQETQTIGVLVPQLNHPFFSALAYAIEQRLFVDQYRSFICSAEESQEKEDAYVDMLLRQRVDGVIMVPTGHSALNVRRLLDMQVPVILVDRDVPGLPISRVLSDNESGAREGARYLLSLGHRRIATIGMPEYSEAVARRRQGVHSIIAEVDIDDYVDIVDNERVDQVEMGYLAGRRLLEGRSRPTAIFAMTDVIAIGVLHAASELGLALPEALSVMGFDDIPMAAYFIPEITTVAQPIIDIGQKAAELLLATINGEQKRTETVILPTRLVVRKSTMEPGVKR